MMVRPRMHKTKSQSDKEYFRRYRYREKNKDAMKKKPRKEREKTVREYENFVSHEKQHRLRAREYRKRKKKRIRSYHLLNTIILIIVFLRYFIYMVTTGQSTQENISAKALAELKNIFKTIPGKRQTLFII